jgi:hypothetical protein
MMVLVMRMVGLGGGGDGSGDGCGGCRESIVHRSDICDI